MANYWPRLAPQCSAHNASLSARIPWCLITLSCFQTFSQALMQLKVRAIKPVPQTEYDRFCTKLHAHYCFSCLENQPNMRPPYRRIWSLACAVVLANRALNELVCDKYRACILYPSPCRDLQFGCQSANSNERWNPPQFSAEKFPKASFPPPSQIPQQKRMKQYKNVHGRWFHAANILCGNTDRQRKHQIRLGRHHWGS